MSVENNFTHLTVYRQESAVAFEVSSLVSTLFILFLADLFWEWPLLQARTCEMVLSLASVFCYGSMELYK